MAVNDVGWCRWLVLFASFVGHAILGFTLDGGGAFHVLFLEAFHGSSGATAVATSLNTCIVYGLGPISGFLVNRFPCWKLAFAGGLIAASGLILSSFVKSLPFIYFTFGLITGTGMGIAYMPIITMVSQVFVEQRAIAFGIMSSGVGIGKFISPLFLHLMNQLYGWRGAILMVGGLCLNLCTCAMIYFRPGLQKPLPGVGQRKLPPLPESPDMEAHDVRDSKCDIEIGCDTLEKNGHANGGIVQNGAGLPKINLMDRIANAGSVISLSGSVSSVRPENGLKKSTLEVSFAHSLQNAEYLETVKREIAKEGSMGGIAGAFSTSSLFLNHCGSSSVEHLPQNGMLARCKQVGSFHSRLGIAKQPSYKLALSHSDLPRSSDANGIASLPGSQLPSSSNVTGDVTDTVVEQKSSIIANLNCHLLTMPSFAILCLNNFLFAMGYAVSNVHLPAFSINVGLSKIEGSYFLSGIGIASIVGKISLGAVSNIGCVSPMTVYIFTFFAVATATVFVPFCATFIQFMTYALFFGFCSGSFGAILPTIVVKMTTVELLPSAYGFLLVFEAIGCLVGPAVAGFLYDGTGDYAAAFYFGGTLMMISALIMFYPWFKQHSKIDEYTVDPSRPGDHDLPEVPEDNIENPI